MTPHKFFEVSRWQVCVCRMSRINCYDKLFLYRNCIQNVRSLNQVMIIKVMQMHHMSLEKGNKLKHKCKHQAQRLWHALNHMLFTYWILPIWYCVMFLVFFPFGHFTGHELFLHICPFLLKRDCLFYFSVQHLKIQHSCHVTGS